MSPRGPREVILQRIDYQYDALGRKVAKKIGSDITGYAYDGGNVQFELDLDDSGVITRHFFYGPGVNEALAVDEQGITVWNFADAVGTVRTVGVVNNLGEWSLVHRNFDQFGGQIDFRVDNDTTVALLGDTGFATLVAAPLIYAGHQFDAELALYDMQARWMDSDNGWFLTQDPARSDSNLYRYVAGDPNNLVDPDGNAIFTTAAIIAGLTYIGTQALFAAAETGIEGAAVNTIGSQQDAENFSYVNSFGKNFGINLLTGGIGGKVKAASTLGRVSLQVGLFAGRQGIEIAGETAFDVYVNNRDFQSSLLVNTAGSLLGEAGGRAIVAGGRRALASRFVQDTGLPFARGFLSARGPLLAAADPITAGVSQLAVGIRGGILNLLQESRRFEGLVKGFVSNELGESIIESQVRRGAADTGFDFLSFTGTGRTAKLFINEIKQETGRVGSRRFTTFGLGRSGERTFQRSLNDARVAITNARLDRTTTETLLAQLGPNGGAVIRAIGSQARGTVFDPQILNRIGRVTGFITGEGFLL